MIKIAPGMDQAYMQYLDGPYREIVGTKFAREVALKRRARLAEIPVSAGRRGIGARRVIGLAQELS